MTLKNLVVLAGLACAGSAFAQPGVVSPSDGIRPVRHMYYHVATGEITETTVGSRAGPQIWGYATSDGWAVYYTDNGSASAARYMQGDNHADEGELAADATIDGFSIWYQCAGGTPTDNSSAVVLNLGFSDTYTSCQGTAPTDVAGYSISGLNSDPTYSWIYTFDLTGLEFNLTAGHTFGYDWSWDLTGGPLVAGIGMILVHDNVTAPGAVNQWQSTGPSHPGCYWFGAANFAQYFMALNGTTGPTGCPADFDGDGTVDFFDYDAFVNCFEGIACPPGKTADFDGDGSADFFDYDAFVVAFETPC